MLAKKTAGNYFKIHLGHTKMVDETAPFFKIPNSP